MGDGEWFDTSGEMSMSNDDPFHQAMSQMHGRALRPARPRPVLVCCGCYHGARYVVRGVQCSVCQPALTAPIPVRCVVAAALTWHHTGRTTSAGGRRRDEVRTHVCGCAIPQCAAVRR